MIELPRRAGPSSPLETSLGERRSVRSFGAQALPLAKIGRLLWAAQGITSAAGERTAPSAGALYPLEIYLAAGNVNGLAGGVYRYGSQSHSLELHRGGDRRHDLADAALGQTAPADAPAVLIVAAVYARTAAKYGARAPRYVHMEAGHAAQNVCLVAHSLGLGTVVMGAFDDDRVRSVLELPARESPLSLLPIGTPRREP